MHWIDLIMQSRRVPGITSVMVYCSPELAESILKLNTHNRKISQSVVDKYVREIENDSWLASSAGIGISESGVLIDGQHRLSAIVKSGKTVCILFVFGLPSASQSTIDRQNKRTLFDVFTLDGTSASRKEVQVATFLARIVDGKLDSNITPADSDIKIALIQHSDAMKVVMEHIPSATAGFTAPVKAALTHAVEIDKRLAIEFMNKLVKPTEITSDDPRYRLHIWLKGGGASSAAGGTRQIIEFRKTVYALQAYFDGRKISCLRESDEILKKS